MGVVLVAPVMTLKAVFWARCSLCVSVFEVVGAHAGLAYSSTGRMYCLYIDVSVSFCLPKSEPATALREFSRGFILFVTSVICCAKVMDVL